MAHEIKNPLTALKTFTQLLPKRYNDAEFRHDFSGLAGSEIARIERIVNQLLAFARPAPLMIEQVALHEIIDGAMRLVGPQASRQQVSVRQSLHADQDFIAADKDRLQQVLLNLLLNALQASEPGGLHRTRHRDGIGAGRPRTADPARRARQRQRDFARTSSRTSSTRFSPPRARAPAWVCRSATISSPNTKGVWKPAANPARAHVFPCSCRFVDSHRAKNLFIFG